MANHCTHGPDEPTLLTIKMTHTVTQLGLAEVVTRSSEYSLHIIKDLHEVRAIEAN